MIVKRIGMQVALRAGLADVKQMHQDQNDMLVGQVCVTYSYNTWWTSRTLKSALAWVGFYANYDCEIGSQNHSNVVWMPHILGFSIPLKIFPAWNIYLPMSLFFLVHVVVCVIPNLLNLLVKFVMEKTS
jgi:hypothetical protein